MKYGEASMSIPLSEIMKPFSSINDLPKLLAPTPPASNMTPLDATLMAINQVR